MIKIGYLGSDDSTLASLELLEETRNEFVTGNPWEDENE